MCVSKLAGYTNRVSNSRLTTKLKPSKATCTGGASKSSWMSRPPSRVIGPSLWSNLPASINAATIARLYRKRWRIEGKFQRLESVLHSEINGLGHPRAALLGFAIAVLAYNFLTLLQRVVEQAHRVQHPNLEVSTYHLAQHIKSGYEGQTIALPPAHWPRVHDDDDPRPSWDTVGT
jgi:IS4 transposase